jgi:glycerophosphoryl diester phosphodiesterase
MNENLSVTALGKSVWRDFLRARRALYIYELSFKLIEAWLLVPAVAVVLAAILAGSGHVAVSNQDILAFLLTPLGLVYAAIFGFVAVALLLFEQAGVMVLATLCGPCERRPFKRMLRAFFGKLLRIVQLGVLQTALLAVALAPFALLAFLIYRILLSEFDIYFYLKERPPAVWWAAGIGGLILLAALALTTALYVRWSLALPILVFENRFSRAALRASNDRVRGAAWRIGVALVGWLVGVVLLGVVLEAGFRLLAAAILSNAGERPIVLIVLLLIAQGGLVASLTFMLVVGFGLLTRRLYLFRSEQLGVVPQSDWEAAPGSEKSISPFNWRLVAWLCLPLFLLAPLALWGALSRYAQQRPPVQVTAHRGHARAAPENTLSAMRKAIESGADYAEMDVQLTADSKVVLLHDSDLKRVAGDPRRLEELSFAEVRRLDVGSWFVPPFPGERVPTLTEVIDLCRGKIRLNIELKFFGPDRRLVKEVVDIVRQQHFESECLITSLNYDALVEVKQREPRLRTGIIVAHALGDINRLQVDALSVRADFLTDPLIHSAHRDGKEVHVWTVNEARQMFGLMKRGVDNIITSDPDLAVQVRDEWANLSGSERMLLASRLLLGLDP